MLPMMVQKQISTLDIMNVFKCSHITGKITLPPVAFIKRLSIKNVKELFGKTVQVIPHITDEIKDV